MKKKIVIEWDDTSVGVSITPKNKVRTSDIVGVLEWVKLSLYEKKKEEIYDNRRN